MEKITTVGLDLAKQVMAVHGVGAEGRMVLRKVLRRDQLLNWSVTLPPCVVAMEACGGAHYWGRELTRQGHTVRIIAAEFGCRPSPGSDPPQQRRWWRQWVSHRNFAMVASSRRGSA